MKKSINVFNFFTDLILSSLFVLIIVSSLIIGVNLSPSGYEDIKNEESVLGITSEDEIKSNLEYSFVRTNDENLQVRSRQHVDNKLTISFSADLLENSVSSRFLTLTNRTEGNKRVLVQFSIPEDFLVDMKYSLLVGEQQYHIYDYMGDRQYRDYELEIDENSVLDLSLKISSYKTVHYPLELTIEFIEMDN